MDRYEYFVRKREVQWYNHIDTYLHNRTDPTNATNTQVLQQYCGGYMNNGSVQPYMQKDGTTGLWSKGFICPQGLVCQVSEKLMIQHKANRVANLNW